MTGNVKFTTVSRPHPSDNATGAATGDGRAARPARRGCASAERPEKVPVLVTLDPPDTPIHRRALRGLVDDLNVVGATYPGTDIPVTYRVAVHQSEAAA